MESQVTDGEKLKYLIRGKVSSMEKAAKLVGLTRKTLYNYFGERVLEKETIKLFEEKVGIDFTQNVTSTDNGNRDEATEIKGVHRSDVLIAPGVIPLPDGRFLLNTQMVPGKAYASYLTSWGDEEYINELPIHAIVVDHNPRGTYRSFEVRGESMDDGTKRSIEANSIVTGRQISRSLWRDKLHLKKFSRYVIVSPKRGIMVKEIISHNTETGVITCHSYNPDKKQHPDFDLPLDQVAQLFNIVQVTKKE